MTVSQPIGQLVDDRFVIDFSEPCYSFLPFRVYKFGLAPEQFFP